MQKLDLISDEELHVQTLTASVNEKQATLVLLEHLAEVDHRRLFALRGYSSLWEYVHKALGFSEAQTSDRVNAVRLIARVPAVKKELEEGNLSLTTAAKLGSHVRREECENNEVLDLLQSVSGKSSREVEKVLASESTQPARPDQIKVVTKNTTRIMMDVDQAFLDLMTRVQELSGHPGSRPQELFKTTMSEFVKRREVKPQEVKTRAKSIVQSEVKQAPQLKAHSNISPKITEMHATNKTEDKNETTLHRAPACKTESASNGVNFEKNGTPIKNSLMNNLKSTDASGFDASQRSRYISKEVTTKIRIRSGDRCEYIDSENKRRCECRTKLQFDHHIPFAKNGANTLENIRHYCFAHNQLAAIQEFGEEKMQRYFKMKKVA